MILSMTNKEQKDMSWMKMTFDIMEDIMCEESLH